MGANWNALKATAFARVEKNDFEDLCRDLLREETIRHADGADRWVEGPLPPDLKDGGRDLLFTVKKPPRRSARAFQAAHGVSPLTPDRGRCAYSCKTGNSWKKRALAEATAGKPRVVQVLKNREGRFVLFTNQQPSQAGADAPASDKESLVGKLAAAYAKHTGMTVKHLVARIEVVDANDLAAYVQNVRPTLARFEDALGVSTRAAFDTFEKWQEFHDLDRKESPTKFRAGSQRTLINDLRKSIRSAAPSSKAAFWIVGPPGIGKTRTVMEALRGTPFRDRVCVAHDADTAIRTLSDGDHFAGSPSSIVVVDDVPAQRITELERFVVQLKPTSALIILSPHGPEAAYLPPVGLLKKISVEPLDEATTRELIAAEIGAPVDGEQVTRVAAVAGGFPWFAVLVAREVAKGAAAPSSVAEAATLALASKRHAADWFGTCVAHGRALLAVMLTEATDWSTLEKKQRSQLLRAVGFETWSGLTEAFRGCVSRGLVRRHAAFKYVTPQILEREVIRLLFTTLPNPPGPRRPGGLGPWAAQFYERVQRLLEPHELRSFANAFVEALPAPSLGVAGLHPMRHPDAALLLAARHAHRTLGGYLRATIAATPVETLRERFPTRSGLVWALAAVARRSGGFDVAEDALFRLAAHEGETFRTFGDGAVRAWGELFTCGLNVTRATWDERVARLSTRFNSAPPAGRLLAVRAVPRMISTGGAAVSHDGEAPTQSVDRATKHRAVLDVWTLLVERTSDPDSEVRSEAQRVVVREIRGAFWAGLADPVVSKLVGYLPAFDDATMRGVREKLETINRTDAERLASDTAHARARDVLADAVTPRTFRDRLRQRVAVLSATTDVGDDPSRDDALAREGLAPPDRLVLAEVDWLLSDDARRRVPFFTALGRCDDARVALDVLLTRARAGQDDATNALSAYCLGMADAGHSHEVDALLRAWAHEDALADARLFTVARVGGTEARALYVVDLLRGGHLRNDEVIHYLATGGWARPLGDDVLLGLLDALLDQASASAAVTVIDLALDRLGVTDRPDLAVETRPRILRAMQRLASERLGGMAAYSWERAGTLLFESGSVSEVCALAVRSVTRDDREFSSDHVWALVNACHDRAPAALWAEVRSVIERGGARADQLALDLRWRGMGDFPADLVMSWVGDHPERARRIASFAPVSRDDLPPIARALVVRFGAGAEPARMLSDAFMSTLGPVKSMAEFAQGQLVRAQAWARDPDPEVRAWADGLAKEIAPRLEEYKAREEYERRRYGT